MGISFVLFNLRVAILFAWKNIGFGLPENREKKQPKNRKMAPQLPIFTHFGAFFHFSAVFCLFSGVFFLLFFHFGVEARNGSAPGKQDRNLRENRRSLAIFDHKEFAHLGA